MRLYEKTVLVTNLVIQSLNSKRGAQSIQSDMCKSPSIKFNLNYFKDSHDKFHQRDSLENAQSLCT